ncbi:hypothetical protein ACIP6X_16885 [Streptomyces coeruleorubidus]|jgi:hypothetical protein
MENISIRPARLRVTVHSSRRAIPAYARCGFQESPRLLHGRIADA